VSEFLSTAQIAELLGCTRKNVTQRVVKSPDFPAPKINRSQKMRRWDAAEVLAWANPGSRQSPQA
jgi:predicted DNA-binding transcriptional regulator AlpA